MADDLEVVRHGLYSAVCSVVRCCCVGREDGSDRGSGFRVDHGIELTEPIHMFVRVVLAEEQLATCGQNGTHTSSRAATITTINRGQWGAGQGSWHDSSVLAPGTQTVHLVWGPWSLRGLASAASQQGYDYSVRRSGRGLCSPRGNNVFSLTRPAVFAFGENLRSARENRSQHPYEQADPSCLPGDYP